MSIVSHGIIRTAERLDRRYRKHTLILETEFETDEGVVRLIDFMPLLGQRSHLVRMVRGDRGSVGMRMNLFLRFDYGCSVPWVTRLFALGWADKRFWFDPQGELKASWRD